MPHALALLAAAALAQSAPAADDPGPRIVVSGVATVQTAPDRATIAYTVHGEGASSDEAVAAMVGKRERIDAGLAALRVAVEAGASRVAVTEGRGPDCRQTYGSARLSTGACAIRGYAADLTVTLRTAAVKEVGTMVGLLGRLGASDPRLDGFALAAPGEAQRRAIAAAIVDARAKAEAVAAGTGVRLGRMISASTTGYGYQDIVVTASRVAPPPPPPPPSAPMAPPIGVPLAPQPITTQAQVSIVYAVGP